MWLVLDAHGFEAAGDGGLGRELGHVGLHVIARAEILDALASSTRRRTARTCVVHLAELELNRLVLTDGVAKVLRIWRRS
jgi:hypothetical protein